MKFTRATINRIFVVLVIFSNTFGNFLLAKGMNQMPDFMATPFLSYVASISTNLYIIGGVALLVAWMIAQLSMFTWADLSYVLPVTASGYVLTAFLGKFLLGEHVSAARWIGVLLITIGSMLVSMTPLRTKARGQEPLL
jgi:transporter family protein